MSAAADALMGIFGFKRVESEMKTVEETRRELFEAKMIERNPGAVMVLYKRPSGKYLNAYVQSAWDGFNADLDAVEIELPFKVGDDNEFDDGYVSAIEDCRAAIESTNLGIKVK